MKIDIPRPVLKGKKALVTGIANDQSIAYGCARAFRECFDPIKTKKGDPDNERYQ